MERQIDRGQASTADPRATWIRHATRHWALFVDLRTPPSNRSMLVAVGTLVGAGGTAGMMIARSVAGRLAPSGSDGWIVMPACIAGFAGLFVLYLLGPRRVAQRAGLEPLTSPETLA